MWIQLPRDPRRGQKGRCQRDGHPTKRWQMTVASRPCCDNSSYVPGIGASVPPYPPSLLVRNIPPFLQLFQGRHCHSTQKPVPNCFNAKEKDIPSKNRPCQSHLLILVLSNTFLTSDVVWITPNWKYWKTKWQREENIAPAFFLALPMKLARWQQSRYCR